MVDSPPVRIFSFMAATMLFVPAVAYADSDGYFCTGQGYLAYQFGLAPPPVGPHRLHVIDLRGPSGIPKPVALDLPQFQVHGMICGDSWVDIASFTSIYRVTLDERRRPIRSELRTMFAGGAIPQEFSHNRAGNLGRLGGANAYVKPVRQSLSTKPDGGGYTLEVRATTLGPKKNCNITVKSRIIETGPRGRQIGERVLFQGRGFRECGDGSEPRGPSLWSN
jgi:hypothetical protein